MIPDDIFCPDCLLPQNECDCICPHCGNSKDNCECEEEDDDDNDKNWDYMRGEPRCQVCGEATSQCDCTL